MTNAPQANGPLSAPTTALEQSAALWSILKKRALKRKAVKHVEAAEALGIPVEEALRLAWPLHVWCWVRGMPPLNVVLVKRGATADPEGGFDSTDYDVMFEALGHTVYNLEHAWHYPWEKVPDPTPEQLGWALAAHDRVHALVRSFRFLDLELDLRLRDEARGTRRPAPAGHATWKDAEDAHRLVVARLKEAGLQAHELRPPGKGPYPPPRPVKGNWAD